jgi:hypothetical protein
MSVRRQRIAGDGSQQHNHQQKGETEILAVNPMGRQIIHELAALKGW